MIYFTSDTHFGSERALKLSKRPFSSVEEMDETMIKNWNSKITNEDEVFHLGDFGNFEVLDKLNGKSINLILGNYEEDEMGYGIFVGRKLMVAYPRIQNIVYHMNIRCGRLCHLNGESDKVFNQSIDIARALNITVEDFYNKMLFRLIHKPSDAIKEENFFNLYGHIHGRQMIRKYGMDVGVDCHHFYPISLEDVLFYWNAIVEHYDWEVFDESW